MPTDRDRPRLRAASGDDRWLTETRRRQLRDATVAATLRARAGVAAGEGG